MQILNPSVTPSSKDTINVGLAASVGSNALTLNLKTGDGNTPSNGSPCKVGMRSSTAATGQFNLRSVTAALSLVISSGSTLGLASGSVNQYVYVYLIDNAGTLELAVSASRIWDEGSLISTTSEGGAGAADSASAIYSTTGRNNVPCRLIARLKFSVATPGTWGEVPDEISLFPWSDETTFGAITVDGGNGFGSSSTKIRRFSNSRQSVGTDITYTDSATLGATFTINRAGVYAISHSDYRTGSASGLGISVNPADRTVAISSTSYANGKRARADIAGANVVGHCSWTGKLSKGDAVCAHGTGSADGTSDEVSFHIERVG